MHRMDALFSIFFVIIQCLLNPVEVKVVRTWCELQVKEIPTAFEDLVDTFFDLLKSPSMNSPLIIFLDGVECLGSTDNACTQPWKWLPRKIPPSVRIVISINSDQRFGILEVLQSGLPDKAFVAVPKLMADECSEVLDAWMMAKARTLSDEQVLITL